MNQDEDEIKWERRLLCELIKAHQSKVNQLGENEWSVLKKHHYYRAAWHLQEAINILTKMNESHESKVIEVSK